MSPYNPKQPWHRGLLWPFWLVQKVFSLIFLIASIWTLTVAEDLDHEGLLEDDGLGDAQKILSIGAIVLLILSAISSLTITIEVIAFVLHKLHPLFYLVTNCIKSAVWTIFLVLSIRGAIETGYATGAILGGLFLAFFLATLVYAILVYHRHRVNVKYSKLHARQPSASDFSPANMDQIWGLSQDTHYDPHNMRRSDMEASELQFYVHGNKHPSSTSTTRASASFSPVINPTVEEEVEHESRPQIAIHPAYRQQPPQQEYEPLQRDTSIDDVDGEDLHQVRRVTLVDRAMNDSSPASSSVYDSPVSPLVTTPAPHEREQASMGGLIKAATSQPGKQ